MEVDFKGHRVAFVPMEGFDPEESLEEELLLAALRERCPVPIEVTDHRNARGAVCFGRLSSAEAMFGTFAWPEVADFSIAYWKIDAFARHARRGVWLEDLDGACRRVEEIHAAGRDAFVKSTQLKLFAGRAPRGEGLIETLDAMAYSFCDMPDCLLVQEFVSMRDEYRMFVVDGDLVSGAGCVVRHTPVDNEARFDPKVSERPTGEPRHDHALVASYVDFAREVLPDLPSTSFTLDLATIDGGIGIVEMNPFVPGRCGLFASDVGLLAEASLKRAAAALERMAPAPAP